MMGSRFSTHLERWESTNFDLTQENKVQPKVTQLETEVLEFKSKIIYSKALTMMISAAFT